MTGRCLNRLRTVALGGALGAALLLPSIFAALARDAVEPPRGEMAPDRRAALERAVADGSVEAALELARLAIADGRYEQAAGALTGLRARDPNDPRIALLLGDLYTRMGVPAQARIYLRQALESARLNEGERRIARALLNFTDTPGARRAALDATDAIWELRARVSSGVRYSTNANNGIASDRILIADTSRPRTDRLAPADDWNAYLFAFGRAGRPLSQDLSLDLRGTVYATAHTEFDDQDIAAGRVQHGLIWDAFGTRAFGLRLQGYGIFGATAVGHEHALTQAGAGIRAIQRIDRSWFFDQTLEARRLSYRDTDERPRLSDHDGDDRRLELGLRHRLTPDLTGRLAYRISARDTRAAHLDRSRHRLRAEAIWALPEPWVAAAGVPRLRAGISYIDTRYEAPPPNVSSEVEREDTEWVFDLEFTVPVGDMVSIELGADFTQTDSNLPNYEREEFSAFTGIRLDF